MYLDNHRHTAKEEIMLEFAAIVLTFMVLAASIWICRQLDRGYRR